MKFVVDWQNKNPSIVQGLEDGSKKPTVLRDDEAKFAWIETLTKEDSIYTELGASADILCALALKQGATVFRIKTWLLKNWRKDQGLDKSDAFVSLKHFAINEPAKFYETPAAVAEVLGLKCLVRHFEITQEMRKSEAHRLRGVATMEFFLHGDNPDAGQPDAPSVQELEEKLFAILGNAREQVLASLKGQPIPETLRRKFGAQFSPKRLTSGIMDEITGRKRTRKDTDLETYLRRRFAESHIFWGIEQEEKHYAAEVEGQLDGMQVYHEVYKKIPGMGPKIAGRIIASIGDIRRFETAYALTAYFGYHVRPDGTCPRRQKGIANIGIRTQIMGEDEERTVDFGAWNKQGRQGLFLWAEQVNKANPKKAPALFPFKNQLVTRKGYVARKYWRQAALEVAGSSPTQELNDFIEAFAMMGEEWLRTGEPMLEIETNPYLVCARELQVVQSPWLMRDALAELLKRSGEEVSDDELAEGDPEADEEEALALGEEAPADGEDGNKKVTKWLFKLPQMDLTPDLKREIRRVMKSSFLSKKRLQLGAIRWLINNVLIRKHIWPLNRDLLGLSKNPNPLRHAKLRAREASANGSAATDIPFCGDPMDTQLPVMAHSAPPAE